MKKALLSILVMFPIACSSSEQEDWKPLLARSQALIQTANFAENRQIEFGTLSNALNQLYSEFFGLNDSIATWIDPDAIGSYSPRDAVGDVSLFSDAFLSARQKFLAMHEVEGFEGPATEGTYGFQWEEDELLLLAEFYPAEDPIWDAFLHAAKVVWEESSSVDSYIFCFAVWNVARVTLDDWPSGNRYKLWLPNWQAGVRANLIALQERIVCFQEGRVPIEAGSNSEIFRVTAGEMLSFYESLSLEEIDQLRPVEIGRALIYVSEKAGWTSGFWTGMGLLEFPSLFRVSYQ